MSRELQAHLREQCPDIPDDVLDDFLGRMDPDYFATFDAADVACHLRAAASLDPEHPARIDVEPKPTGMLRVIVIAYDYISEFAMICGVLSAFGLDIREAAIFTSLEASEPASVRRRGPTGKKRRSSVTSRRYIIDVFQVLPTDGIDLFETQRTELASMMEQAIRLLDGRRFADARRLVNRRLIETLGKRHEAASALLGPTRRHFCTHSATRSRCGVCTSARPGSEAWALKLTTGSMCATASDGPWTMRLNARNSV
jgi:glutamate-ammonia-ligase adenylyltransferase